MYRAFYSLSGAPFSKENAKLFASKSAREGQGTPGIFEENPGHGAFSR